MKTGENCLKKWPCNDERGVHHVVAVGKKAIWKENSYWKLRSKSSDLGNPKSRNEQQA